MGIWWAADRPFYVVSPVRGCCPDQLLDRYELERTGLVWKVKRAVSDRPNLHVMRRDVAVRGIDPGPREREQRSSPTLFPSP